MQTFWQTLRAQRWDDHRYYHHSRINQSLHLLSALSFLASYAVVWKSPALAAMLGWLVAMVSRQCGHFFFEPKGYDRINHATHAHKEDIKVGYNLRRKVVLLAVWALAPAVLWFALPITRAEFISNVAVLWLSVGIGGLLFRTVQLFFIRDVQTGLVWLTKIITDPFHDVLLYYRAPLALLRGELIDPICSTRPEALRAAAGGGSRDW